MTGRILAILGDRFHAPEIVRDGLSIPGLDQWEIDFALKPDEVPWQRLPDYTAILLSKAGYDYHESLQHCWLGENDLRLRSFVESGGGLLVLHSGLAGYSRNEVMRQLCKGAFTHHPHGVIPQQVRPVENSIFLALPSFEVTDEQYFVEFHSLDTIQFLETHSVTSGRASAGWAHASGQGRVVCLTPGHTAEVFASSAYQQILQVSLDWVTRAEGRCS